MADIMSSLQLALDITKKLRDLNERVKDADMKILLADLQGEIADAKLEVVSLKEQLAAALTTNAEFLAQIEARSAETPQVVPGGYRFGEEGPFCATCFETNGKQVRLAHASGIHAHFGAWRCPLCKNHT